MKNIFNLFLFITLLGQSGMAQLIDRYGCSIGAAYTKQTWEYKLIPVNNSDKDYKTGAMVFVFAESNIFKILSLRTGLGYIQKGFKNNIELTDADGETVGVDKKNVIFHDLGLDIALKIGPFKKFPPYALIGLRGDYMFAYKDIEYVNESTGDTYNMYKSQIDDFNKINLGGIIGVGCEIIKFFFVELEYNPTITKSYENSALVIEDNCWDAKIGINLNEIIRR